MKQIGCHIEKIYQSGGERPCEDQILIGQSLFGVFDGASSLNETLINGQTGAWWASHLVCQEYSKNDASLDELGARANERLKAAMKKAGVRSEDRLSCWSTSAAVVSLSGDRINWSQIGDCHILAISKDGHAELLNSYHNHDRSTLIQLKALMDRGVRDSHKAVRPKIEAVRQSMNRDYGVINGDDAALSFLEGGSCSLSEVSHLLLVTDGLMPPSENPEEDHDFQWIANLYLEGGLALVQQRVRELEQTDPKCQRYPRFKPHDDIAGIALSFN